MTDNILKQDRERIKALIQRKIEGIDVICSERKTKRGKRSIGRSKVIEMLEDLIFRIDNPDYLNKEERESLSIS